MTQFGIKRHEESDGYTVSFSKPQFQEFMSSLASTPREEVFVIKTGFDISKDCLRTIVEKLRHQVKTQNNLVSEQYTITCVLENGHEVTWQTYEQFFGTREVFKEKVTKLSVAITYLIGFNRSGKQMVERQVVVIDFLTRPAGWVKTRIMSTELTWPPSIFQLIEREVHQLSDTSAGNPDNELAPLRWIIKGMLGKLIYNHLSRNTERYVSEYRAFEGGRIKIYMALITMQFFALMVMIHFVNNRPIYNPDSGFLESGTFQTYVDSMGLQAAAEHVRVSSILHTLNYADWAPGHSTASHMISAMQSPAVAWGVLIGLMMLLLSVYCKRKSESYFIAMKGRIFLVEGKIPAREKLPKGTGIFVGTLTGLFSTALWVGAFQFFSLIA